MPPVKLLSDLIQFRERVFGITYDTTTSKAAIATRTAVSNIDYGRYLLHCFGLQRTADYHSNEAKNGVSESQIGHH